MDVRDIMIGDYVEDPDYGICKVVAINLTMGERTLSLEIVGDITEPFVCVDPKGVNPIKLTEQILKKLGFVKKIDWDEWVHYDSFPFIDFILRTEEDYLIIDCMCPYIKIEYLHELQHAFNLSKLKELEL